MIAADCALHSHPPIIDALVEVLARSRRHRGHTAARLALLFADGRSESVGESRLRIFLHQHGFAHQSCSARSSIGAGKLIGENGSRRSDVAGTLIEFDGMAKYGKLV